MSLTIACKISKKVSENAATLISEALVCLNLLVAFFPRSANFYLHKLNFAILFCILRLFWFRMPFQKELRRELFGSD